MSKVLAYIELNEWKRYILGNEAIAYSKSELSKNLMHVMVDANDLIDCESLESENEHCIKYFLKKNE